VRTRPRLGCSTEHEKTARSMTSPGGRAKAPSSCYWLFAGAPATTAVVGILSRAARMANCPRRPAKNPSGVTKRASAPLPPERDLLLNARLIGSRSRVRVNPALRSVLHADPTNHLSNFEFVGRHRAAPFSVYSCERILLRISRNSLGPFRSRCFRCWRSSLEAD
jgi:hypothetical protein